MLGKWDFVAPNEVIQAITNVLGTMNNEQTKVPFFFRQLFRLLRITSSILYPKKQDQELRLANIELKRQLREIEKQKKKEQEANVCQFIYKHYSFIF